MALFIQHKTQKSGLENVCF